MIDSKANSSLLYLPLDRLLQGTATGGSIVPPINPATGSNELGASTTVPPPETRSRDGQRTRDRESR